MNIMRTALAAVFSATLGASAASATDYYVQPITPGPVQGTALLVVNLQASTAPKADSAEEATPEVKTKWLRAKSEAAGDAALPVPEGTLAHKGATARDLATQPIIIDMQAATTAPWKSVGQLLSSGVVKGGDRIFLKDGYHGPLVVRGYKFTSPVTIAPEPGATAHVESILVGASSNVIFKDLKVWPVTQVSTAPIVRTYSDTSDLAFVNLDIRGSSDAGNYMKWTLTDWQNGLRNAMLIQGQRQTVANTRVTGVENGILTTGDDALMDNNIVDGFSADAMRALGDRSIVRGNKVQNCFDLGTANHRDGFQTYSIGPTGKIGAGTQYGLTVEDNKIFEWTSPIANPLRCRLQGISMFDGMYDGFKIQNNVVSVSAYHGITVAGAINTVIRQNTVVNPSGQPGKWPWIRYASHKNGTPSHDSQIYNNFAQNVVTTSDPTRNIVVSNNVRVGPASSEFVDFANENLALSATSTGVDKGNPTVMTKDDIMGVIRFKGKAPDVGAYESR